MRTILITGGSAGLGKGIARYYLKKGDRVISVGSSIANGNAFLDEAKQIDAAERAFFIQADLSLISENQRLIKEIKNGFPVLGTLIFCAAKHQREYIETAEGFEFTFALAYLSRFMLSYGFKDCLEKSDDPVILNVCGTGMKGNVNWDDLQHKNRFDTMKVMMHGSRLNDLLGVEFAKNDAVGKIKYMLYNPMAVQTPGMSDFSNVWMKLIYKLIAKPIEKAVLPIIELLDNPPIRPLISYTQRKENSLSKETFDTNNAQRLFGITNQLLVC
jgi:NAD(P)-dependent dehydrogenase (short-subunit alcohol dehydrogenase family)